MSDFDIDMESVARDIQNQAASKLAPTVKEIAYDAQKIYVVLDGAVEQSRNEFLRTLWSPIEDKYSEYVMRFMDASDAATQPVQAEDGITYRLKLVEKEQNPFE